MDNVVQCKQKASRRVVAFEEDWIPFRQLRQSRASEPTHEIVGVGAECIGRSLHDREDLFVRIAADRRVRAIDAGCIYKSVPRVFAVFVGHCLLEQIEDDALHPIPPLTLVLVSTGSSARFRSHLIFAGQKWATALPGTPLIPPPS